MSGDPIFGYIGNTGQIGIVGYSDPPVTVSTKITDTNTSTIDFSPITELDPQPITVNVPAQPAPNVSVDTSGLEYGLIQLEGVEQQQLAATQTESANISTGNMIQIALAVAGLIGALVLARPKLGKGILHAIGA